MPETTAIQPRNCNQLIKQSSGDTLCLNREIIVLLRHSFCLKTRNEKFSFNRINGLVFCCYGATRLTNGFWGS